MDYYAYNDLETKAREKGCGSYFEFDVDTPPPVFDEDDERIRMLKTTMHRGSLYMERNADADYLARVWQGQGWTVHVAQFTHVGYLGPRFLKRLGKIIDAYDGGDFIMQPVERSWAVVIATRKFADIKPFKIL